MGKGSQLAKKALTVFGVFLAGVAFLTLTDKPLPWRSSLIFAGASLLCFALVRAPRVLRRGGRGDGGYGGYGGEAGAGVPARPIAPVLVGSAANAFPSEQD